MEKTLETSISSKATGAMIVFMGAIILWISASNFDDGLNIEGSMIGVILAIVMLISGVFRILGKISFNDKGIFESMHPVYLRKYEASKIKYFTIGRSFGFGSQSQMIEFRSEKNRVIFRVSEGQYDGVLLAAKEWADLHGVVDGDPDGGYMS